MEARYAPLKPLGLAVGFGVGALIAMALFFVPMAFSAFGMHGYGSMMGARGSMMGAWGSILGPGTALLACIWAAFVSAVTGGVIAVVYNALIGATTAGDAASSKSS